MGKAESISFVERVLLANNRHRSCQISLEGFKLETHWDHFQSQTVKGKLWVLSKAPL